MAEHEFTPDQIAEGIRRALAKHDVKAVNGLIALLALQDPHRAEAIRQTILVGLRVTSASQPTEQEPS